MRPLMTEKNNCFELKTDKDIDLITTDAMKLRQILVNLLSNAAKFTHNGTINCYIVKQKEWLIITIKDSGIGMTSEQMTHLFKPFVQADASTTRKYGGTGLGLTISKQFCEMLGGTILVNSEFGQGSAFTVKIPLVAKKSIDKKHSNLARKINAA